MVDETYVDHGLCQPDSPGLFPRRTVWDTSGHLQIETEKNPSKSNQKDALTPPSTVNTWPLT
jgi:hypothetical protein